MDNSMDNTSSASKLNFLWAAGKARQTAASTSGITR